MNRFLPALFALFASGCGGGGGGGGNACAPSGAPIPHGSDITSDQTWASGIHQVTTTLHVKDGATLTIDACAVVQMAASASIVVDGTAVALAARGTSSSPVTFTRADPGAPWGALRGVAPATMTLSWTTLEGGGGDSGTDPSTYHGASLVALGDPATVPVALKVDHVTVQDSTGLGLFLQSARLDSASTDLAVTGAGWYPVYGGIASVASLPAGDYTGNAIDQILLQTTNVAALSDSAPLEMDATLDDRGVPYRVGTIPSNVVVGSGRLGDPPALLTLGPSVTMLFTPSQGGAVAQLVVNGISDGMGGQAQGALAVLGTDATPVVLDSAADSPLAGDWQGLYFANYVSPLTVVSGAQIRHGGAPSGATGVCESAPGSGSPVADCALVIMVETPPSSFFQDSGISDSAGCGIYRGWKSQDVDFKSANQFSRVPGCLQTNIPDDHNLCPHDPCTNAM